MIPEKNVTGSGWYAKKQILCGFLPVRFSHTRRYRFCASLIERLKAGTVIDYGCGDATLLSCIHKKINQGIGIELPGNIIALKERFKDFGNINFYSSEELKALPEIKAEVLLCTEVLEHVIAVPEILDAFKKCVLKTGHIIVSVPNEIGFMCVVKYLLRLIAGWQNVSDYKYYEKYSFREFIAMVFAGKDTYIPRKIQNGAYSHQGFNWKYFKAKYLDGNFEILNVDYTPFPFLGAFLNSQIWFTLKVK